MGFAFTTSIEPRRLRIVVSYLWILFWMDGLYTWDGCVHGCAHISCTPPRSEGDQASRAKNKLPHPSPLHTIRPVNRIASPTADSNIISLRTALHPATLLVGLPAHSVRQPELPPLAYCVLCRRAKPTHAAAVHGLRGRHGSVRCAGNRDSRNLPKPSIQT